MAEIDDSANYNGNSDLPSCLSGCVPHRFGISHGARWVVFPEVVTVPQPIVGVHAFLLEEHDRAWEGRGLCCVRSGRS